MFAQATQSVFPKIPILKEVAKQLSQKLNN